MKYCNDYAALLDLFVDGELTPAEMADVQAHLDGCPGCRAYVDDALAMRAAFPDVEDTVVPEGFAQRVMEAVAAAPAAKPARKKTPWLKVAMPLAACLAVVIVLQNGPVSDGRGWGAGSAKMESAPAAAAPAMTETTAEAAPAAEAPKLMMRAEPPAEAPAAMIEESGAEECFTEASASDAFQDAAPAETASAAKSSATENFMYTTALIARLELPAEAFRFLEGFPVAAETETELCYQLNMEEYETLRGQLKHADIKVLAEEGISADTEQVLVVLQK